MTPFSAVQLASFNLKLRRNQKIDKRENLPIKFEFRSQARSGDRGSRKGGRFKLQVLVCGTCFFSLFFSSFLVDNFLYIRVGLRLRLRLKEHSSIVSDYTTPTNSYSPFSL